MEAPIRSQSDDGAGSASSSLRLAWALVALAIVLRIYRYLLNTPVWCDELWLLRNIVGKGFFEQLGPLTDVQAAPPLFLWLERGMWLAFGPSTYAMRFLPMLASCGVMLLLVPVGRRILSPQALPWAILLLGMSDAILNYTCDVKPYTTDSLLALAIPALFYFTGGWSLGWRLVLFTALAPVAIFLSYPGCFIYAGLFLALLPNVWAMRAQKRTWIGYVGLMLTTGLCFALLVLGPVRAQRTAELNACWTDFPEWDRPWLVPFWSVEAVVRFLEHLWRPTGAAFVLAAALGWRSIWRRGLRTELLIIGVPAALAMLAAWLHAFPFESRVALYVAPCFALLIAEGIADVMAWARRLRRAAGREGDVVPRRGQPMLLAQLAVLGILGVVIGSPLARTCYHVVAPAPRLTEENWPETATGDDIAPKTTAWNLRTN